MTPWRISLVAIHSQVSPDAVPLGIGSIAASIRASKELASRVEPIVLEATIQDAMGTNKKRHEAIQSLVDAIIASGPNILGISLFVWNRGIFMEVVAQVRRALPSIILWAGGPDAGADREACERDFAPDLIVSGPGESQVCRALENLCHLGPGNPANDLASPWLQGTLDPQHYQGVLWELTRGCPFSCTFCYEGRGDGRVIPLPMERIRQELDFFISKKVKQVFVLDPTFNANKKRTKELLELLETKAPDIHWRFEVRAEFLDQEQAEAFARLNCSLQIGLQSAHPPVLSLVGRTLKRSEFASKVNLLNLTGAIFGLDIIYGLPGDTYQGFCASLDYALGLQPNHLDVFGLAVLPGTQLALDAQNLGLVHQTTPPYLVLETPSFNGHDLARAKELASALDLLYNKGRAVPWFLSVAKLLGATALGVGASKFFEGFKGSANEHQEIETLQVAWFSKLLDSRGRSDLIPVVRDLIGIHGAWSRAWADSLETSLVLSHDPWKLLGPESKDLQRLARSAKANAYPVLVAFKRGEITITTNSFRRKR